MGTGALRRRAPVETKRCRFLTRTPSRLISHRVVLTLVRGGIRGRCYNLTKGEAMKSLGRLLTVPLAAAILLSLAACGSARRGVHLAGWPANSAPEEIGKRVAQNFLARQLAYEWHPR